MCKRVVCKRPCAKGPCAKAACKRACAKGRVQKGVCKRACAKGGVQQPVQDFQFLLSKSALTCSGSVGTSSSLGMAHCESSPRTVVVGPPPPLLGGPCMYHSTQQYVHTTCTHYMYTSRALHEYYKPLNRLPETPASLMHSPAALHLSLPLQCGCWLEEYLVGS